MESPLHDPAVQSIVDRQQTHALMVGHVGVDDDAAAAATSVLARKVNRFVETHRTLKTHTGQALQVLRGRPGEHRQREERRVRRNDQVFGDSWFQGQGGHAKGVILIDLIRVHHAVGAFGNAPGHALFTAVFHLPDDGLTARAFQQ